MVQSELRSRMEHVKLEPSQHIQTRRYYKIFMSSELDNIKGLANISNRGEFIKNANVNSKIKKDDFEDIKE